MSTNEVHKTLNLKKSHVDDWSHVEWGRWRRREAPGSPYVALLHASQPETGRSQHATKHLTRLLPAHLSATSGRNLIPSSISKDSHFSTRIMGRDGRCKNMHMVAKVYMLCRCVIHQRIHLSTSSLIREDIRPNGI